MRRVCAWCDKELGSAAASAAGSPVTHGICPDCVRKIYVEKASPLNKYLDRFEKPVFILDAEGRIVSGNDAGMRTLARKPDDVAGMLGGDAFGCKYAELPGGCGKTVHCKTCTIRNTVMETLETGKSRVEVPAFPDLHFITGENRLCFMISTERVGNNVLLRIDEITEVRADPCGPECEEKPKG